MQYGDLINIESITGIRDGVYRVIGVGHTDEELGTYLHLAHTTEGRHQKNGFCPIQACAWTTQIGL
jgi:hypothetical protein